MMENTIKDFNLKTEELKSSYMENPNILNLRAILDHSISFFYLELPVKNVIEKKKEIIKSLLDILIPQHNIYFLKNVLAEDEMNSLFNDDKKDELKDIFNAIIDKIGLINVLSALANEPDEDFPTSFVKNNYKYNGFESCEKILSSVKVNNVNLFDLENNEQLFVYLLKRDLEDKKINSVIEYLKDKINYDRISSHFFKNMIITMNIFEENKISIEEEMSRKNKYFSFFNLLNIENIYGVDFEEIPKELDEIIYDYVATVMKNTPKLFSEICGDNKYELPHLTDPFFFSGLMRYVAESEPQFVVELIEIVKKQGAGDTDEYSKRNQQTLHKILSLKEKKALENVLKTNEDVQIKKRL